MADRKHWFGSPASAYAPLIPVLTAKAREHGYAVGVHGSMNFDLDLLLVPWTDFATPRLHVLAALAESVGLDPATILGPEEKPHGRLAHIFPLGNGLALDVSVMPRKEPPDAD